MKKQKQKVYKQPAVIIMATLVFLALFATYLGRHKISDYIHPDTNPTASTSDANTDTQPLVNQVNYGPSDPSANDTINEQKKNADQTTNNAQTTISATITNTRVINGYAQVSVLINGAKSGNCMLLLSKSGASDIIKTVPVINRNGIYTCTDFDIPSSSLSSGQWTAKVTVNDGQSQATTPEAALQV